MIKLLFLAGQFAQIGLFAIGGGLATLPFLYDMADKSDWLSREIVGNMFAVAQSLPGAIGINLAAYTGFRYAGTGGGYLSAISLAAPSILIIAVIAGMLKAFKENRLVQSLFSGFRPAAAGLLSAAAWGAISLALYNKGFEKWFEIIRWKEAALFLALFVLIHKFKKHPAIYIAAAAVAGAVLGL